MSSYLSSSSPQWSSRVGFLMAAVGASVGLGNLWRFSAEAGSNGGGAFILVYLLSVIFIGIPILMSELIIGRAGHANSAVISSQDLCKRSDVSQYWSSGAWIGMIAAFLIVSFYCVVAAWVMAYVPKFLSGSFATQSSIQISNQFDTLISKPTEVVPWFLVFAFITTFFVSRGVNKGIEFASKILMPVFFLLLLGLSAFSIIHGLSSGGTWAAIKFLYTPDIGKINGSVALGALGQAFFSLGIGSAIMITYGSYLSKSVSIPRSAIFIGFCDTLVALIAGFAIFPIVFTYGLDFDAGAGLFFQTLPVALSNIPGGNIIGASFFTLAIFAAITSSISLLEPSVAYVAERYSIRKSLAALICGLAMSLLGMVCIFRISFMDFIDTRLTGPIMLPLSGLIVIVFVGLRLKRTIIEQELSKADLKLANFLLFFVRYVAPILVGAVLISGIFDKYIR